MGTIEEFVHIKCDCPASQYLLQSFSMLEIAAKSISIHTEADIDPKLSYAICEHTLADHTSAFEKVTSGRIICVYEKAKLNTTTAVHYLRYPYSIYDFKHVLLFLTRADTNENDEMSLLTKELVGSSTAIKNIRLLIRQVANSDSNVLILGESGTGKEVIASCIHQLSSKRNFPFVPLNCGAIPSELIESELFGHEKGAFTGAATRRIGRFEIANQGTLFLDEIGDMPLNMQVKLLRVLQERKIERVGSTKSIDIDVKIISATNKNLEDMITHGTFREDLYYRINVIPIFVPTVRERADDIPLLINSLMERISKRIVNNTLFSDEAIQTMCHYSWPGNIRELANFIERMVVICHDRVVTKNDVADQLNKIKSRHHALPLPSDLTNFSLKDYLANIEQQIINNALEKANGIVSSAAEYLNLRRTTLIEKMKKYQLITNE